MIKLLSDYIPLNEEENSDRDVMIAYFKAFDNVFLRDNHFGHMTCSPWIINKDFTKVLMIYHNIYNSWGWCGGHCDGDDDLKRVALKEGKEETGLLTLDLCSDEILSLEILPVPAHVKHDNFVSAHVHLNITYLCIADESEELFIKPDENSGVRWIGIDEIDKYVSEEEMKPVYHKLVKKSEIMITNLKEKNNLL